MDRPHDPAALAAAALEGLNSFTTDESEVPGRALICDIPDQAFTELCFEIARRVEQSALPVGQAVEAAVAAMAGTALDPFSYYLPPEQAGSFRNNGVVSGVGVLLDATDAVGSKCATVTAVCELRIVFVLEDNPGEQAGLMTGDVITAIDGVSVDGMRFVEAGSLIAGDETGVVELEVDRGSDSLTFTITRGELTVPTVVSAMPVPGVGYLKIPDFEDDIPGLVDDGLSALNEVGYTRLVLDLRDNPGGYVDVAISVTSEFYDDGIVMVETDGVDILEHDAVTGGLALNKDIIILVNEGTASAAEVMASALRDQLGAIIVGEPTFGKNAVQIAFELNNGGELYVVVSRWLSPDGFSVEGRGLIPDFEADMPANMSVEEVVELALEIAG